MQEEVVLALSKEKKNKKRGEKVQKMMPSSYKSWCMSQTVCLKAQSNQSVGCADTEPQQPLASSAVAAAVAAAAARAPPGSALPMGPQLPQLKSIELLKERARQHTASSPKWPAAATAFMPVLPQAPARSKEGSFATIQSQGSNQPWHLSQAAGTAWQCESTSTVTGLMAVVQHQHTSVQTHSFEGAIYCLIKG